MTKTSIKKNLVCGKIVIKNDRGLHTRPSTELVKCASMFKSKISLHYRRHSADAKSLLGILILAAEKGAKIKIEAEGADAEEALQAIIDLSLHNFYIKY